MLVMPQYLGLHKALWERQQSAVSRSQPERLAVAEAARQVPARGNPLALCNDAILALCLRRPQAAHLHDARKGGGSCH